jgi:hypothetical protein
MFHWIMFATGLLISGIGMSAAAADPTWGGFYVDGAIGARSTTTDIKTSATYSTYSENRFNRIPFTELKTDTYDTADDGGRTNFLGQIAGGWRWDNGQIVAGIGLFVDLAGDDAGRTKDSGSSSITSWPSGVEGGAVYSDSAELKQTSRYGISLDIAPSWRTQPYLKVVYAWSDIELKMRTSECGTSRGYGPTALSYDETYSGLGIGGGVRHRVDDHLYFFAEAMWQDLGSKSFNSVALCGDYGSLYNAEYGEYATGTQTVKVEPTNLTGVVGIGWKF